MIPVGATLNERFTLDQGLGQGGMGTVYRATDKLLGRNVAIKFLKDSGTEEDAHRIRLEAQILARLLHDKIVRLYDFGESEGHYFLVMEEVNGQASQVAGGTCCWRIGCGSADRWPRRSITHTCKA